MNEDLYVGPTLLAPGPPDTGRGDRIARRIFVPLAVLLVAVLSVFYLFFNVTVVQGESMQPSLADGDRLLVTKTYDDPQRGDVVVFNKGQGPTYEGALIKRVIAIPGDTVSLDHGIATVNGVVEDVTGLTLDSGDLSSVSPTLVESGTVFVLGDNRPIALDSRDLGLVPVTTLRGKAVFLFAPITKMHVLR